jgi:hypothetical protein
MMIIYFLKFIKLKFSTVIGWKSSKRDKIHKIFFDKNPKVFKNFIPRYLREMTFNDKIDKPLFEGIFPDTLTSIRFGDAFNRELNVKFPDSLTELSFCNSFNKPLIPGIFPDSLRTLRFGGRFNQRLVPGIFPTNLTTLELGNNFDEPLLPGVLPSKLVDFLLHSSYHHRLVPNIIPKSLKCMHFSFWWRYQYYDDLLKLKKIQSNTTFNLY